MSDTSFRLFLQSELARRQAGNPRYSLRAFARRLRVDHSTLSQWMRGRRALSARAIETMGPALGLSRRQVRRFVEGRRGPEVSAQDLALLALTARADFRPDSRWIARELGISVDAVNITLQRLLRLELLELAAPNRWVDTSGGRDGMRGGGMAAARQGP